MQICKSLKINLIITNYLIVILFVFSSKLVYSQNKYNFNTLNNDFEKIFNQPGNWKQNDWLTILGVAGLTCGSMYIDQMVREIALNNNEYRNSIPIEFGRIWGDPFATIAIGGSFYLQGLAANNVKNKNLGFEIGESALFSSVITYLFKFSFGRERPRENSNPFLFFPFSFKNNNFLSFSSGHTALAFSLSTVLSKNTSNNYLKALMFIPAFMTAFSRVYQNHHWTSDVILGGVIGFCVAEFITGLHQAKHSKDELFSPQSTIKLMDFRIPL